MRFALVAAIALMGVAANGGAQGRRIATGGGGSLYRYNGDTIWVERDTTVLMVVYRGDTVTEEQTMNGHRVYSWRWVRVSSDSARLVSAIDSAGKPMPVQGRMIKADMMYRHRTLLEGATVLDDALSKVRDPNEVPLSPANAIWYCVNASRMLMQRGDTARLITRSGARADTTVFVFGKDTTVQRVSPSPRGFGYAMYNALVGEMRRASSRQTSPCLP